MRRTIEVGEHKLDEDKLMELRIRSRGGEESRLILPSASWNTSGGFLLHSLVTGRIVQVPDIIELLRENGLLDDILVKD